MEALYLKSDTLQYIMKEDTNTCLDERGVSVSGFHTNNIMDAVVDSEKMILASLELQTSFT